MYVTSIDYGARMATGTLTYTTSTNSMPKFKKGDVIVCNDHENHHANNWIFEHGEKFFVQGADHDTYWLRVMESSDKAQKDFSTKACNVDPHCEIYKASKCANSTSKYFPNLSHV